MTPARGARFGNNSSRGGTSCKSFVNSCVPKMLQKDRLFDLAEGRKEGRESEHPDRRLIQAYKCPDCDKFHQILSHQSSSCIFIPLIDASRRRDSERLDANSSASD